MQKEQKGNEKDRTLPVLTEHEEQNKREEIDRGI